MYYPAGRPTTFGVLPSGADGIRQTLKIMVALNRTWKKDPGIRQLACELVRELPQGDSSAEVRALQSFVRDHIRYTNDIAGVETLQTPRVTLESGVGDCDDKSLLLSSLLSSIGRPNRFVAIGLNGGPLSHVTVEVRLGARQNWYMLETIKDVEAGWQPKNITSRMVAHT